MSIFMDKNWIFMSIFIQICMEKLDFYKNVLKTGIARILWRSLWRGGGGGGPDRQNPYYVINESSLSYENRSKMFQINGFWLDFAEVDHINRKNRAGVTGTLHAVEISLGENLWAFPQEISHHLHTERDLTVLRWLATSGTF